MARTFVLLPTMAQQDFIQNVTRSDLFITLFVWAVVRVALEEDAVGNLGSLLLNAPPPPRLRTPRAFDALMSEDFLSVSRHPGYWRVIPSPRCLPLLPHSL